PARGRLMIRRTERVRSIHRRRRAQLLDLFVWGHHARSVDIFEVRHRALAILQGNLTDIGADGRLMVARAEFERPERALDLEPAERRDQLVGVVRALLGDAGGKRVDGVVTDHRTQPRIVVPSLLIGGDERLVRRRVDRLPGIAGAGPADRRLVLERIEIFRLAREQADDDAVLERPAGRTLAYQLGEVGAEQDVEDGVRLGVVDRLDHGACLDLAERAGLV